LGIFQHGNLPRQWNNTTISLIPKAENPAVVAKYWPIACCNN